MKIDQSQVPAALLTREVLEEEVEETVWMLDVTHVEAVLKIAEDRGMEVEAVASLIGPTLAAKLEGDFVDLNFLKSRPLLPDYF